MVAEHTTWKKILYESQPFNDEYSGGSEFLKELRTNINVVEYTYMEGVYGASRIMMHANAIVFYFLIFIFVKNTTSINCTRYFGIFFIISSIMYLIYLSKMKPNISILQDHLLTFIAVVCFGYALTPIVRTLTDTISTDTIYAMSCLLFLISFVFHDYAMDAPLVSTILSVNLCLAASVCLISRVESNGSAFCLLLLSMILFSYWPQMRNRFYMSDSISSLYMISFSSPIIFSVLYQLSLSFSILYAFTHLFVTFFCPWILIKMQPLKSTKHGPWDEATANFLR